VVEGKLLQSVDCQFSRNEVEHNDWVFIGSISSGFSFDCGEDAIESFHVSIGDSSVSKADNTIKVVEDTFSCCDHRLEQVAFRFTVGLYPISPLDKFSLKAFHRVQLVNILQV
jgi:hypothetical protein